MENELLWKLQQDFEYEKQKRIHKAKYCNITIKELLDLGFNNNYLCTELYGTIELGWKNEDGSYQYDLTDKQLNVRIVMDEDFDYDEDNYLDGDGYVIAKVRCVNKEEEELFKEVK